jgi:2-oxoglutarate/2-oxoacid ferredoxin oxidoreductase subunit alpha
MDARHASRSEREVRDAGVIRFAGVFGVTSNSGPGIALNAEAIGLTVATEIPLVVVNAQRAGPSTGLPTKTEQSDLHEAVFGRNGDAKAIVVVIATPLDSFGVSIEAVRIATKSMTPVMLLSDGFLANTAEPWLIPAADAVEPFPVRFRVDPDRFSPFARDAVTLARPGGHPRGDPVSSTASVGLSGMRPQAMSPTIRRTINS